MYGRKILAMAGAGMVHYAMHTNYDVAKMAELAEHATAFDELYTA